MALFDECMQKCAQKVLDLADIVRDGDFSSFDLAAVWHAVLEYCGMSTQPEELP